MPAARQFAWLLHLPLVACLCAIAGAATDESPCPDKILNNTGMGGAGFTALANVSDQGACCALCHGDYHDECVAWVFGETAGEARVVDDLSTPAHNCAIMPMLLPPRPVLGHVSGYAGNLPPPSPPGPGPLGPPCRADLDCRLQGQTGWRCLHDPAGSPSPDNNCHLPGPGTRGNATCACGSQVCSGGPSPGNQSALQYLVIGDRCVLAGGVGSGRKVTRFRLPYHLPRLCFSPHLIPQHLTRYESGLDGAGCRSRLGTEPQPRQRGLEQSGCTLHSHLAATGMPTDWFIGYVTAEGGGPQPTSSLPSFSYPHCPCRRSPAAASAVERLQVGHHQLPVWPS